MRDVEARALAGTLAGALGLAGLGLAAAGWALWTYGPLLLSALRMRG